MAGNSKRKGAIKKTGKGNPTAGSGGRVRRGLEGRGPTPKAKDRPYHQAHKDAAKSERAKARTGTGTGTRKRNASDADWAAGRNSVVELLRASVPVTAIYVAEGAERDNRLREAFKLSAEQGVKLLEVTRNEMDRMTSGAVHQGLAARLPAYEYAHADDLLDRADEAKEPALIVALDSVTDPRNLGAIVRSAAGFGAHGVLIPERRAAGMTASAWKTSAGAAARLPDRADRQPDAPAQGLQGSRLHGRRPRRADGDISLPELVAPGGLAEGPLVVVVGSEGKGLGRLIGETCDQIVSIPMAGSSSRSTPVSLPPWPSTRSRRPAWDERHPTMSRPRRLAVGVTLVALSVTLGLAVAVSLFLNSSRTVVLVGHDTVVRPTLSGDASSGPGRCCPTSGCATSVRSASTSPSARPRSGSIEELVERYAFIASDPDAQIEKVEGVVIDMAVSAAVRGLGVGLLPIAVFLLLGRHRRGELFRGLGTRPGLLAFILLLALPVLIWQPWESREETQQEQGTWQTLEEVVGPVRQLPAEARDIEIRTGPVTTQTKRLVMSALDTYDRSKEFYSTAADGAADLDVRLPEDGETVALLRQRPSRQHRHGPRRAGHRRGRGGERRARRGGRHLDRPAVGGLQPRLAGQHLRDWERFGVAGNHDHGTFVTTYLADLGWTMLDGEIIDAPWGGTLLGVDDPR